MNVIIAKGVKSYGLSQKPVGVFRTRALAPGVVER